MAIEMTQESVFDAVEGDPAIVEVMKIKAALLDSSRAFIEKHGLNHQQAPDLMGVQRSRIGDVSRR